MKITSAQAMKRIDKFCVENLKIPSIVLMENAALKVLAHAETERFNSYVVLCGIGNNGGDGLAVARHLFVNGKKVKVFLVGSGEMSEDCSINFHILKELGVTVKSINNVEDITELREEINTSDAVIDAVFGTGLSRNIEGIYSQIISVINENSDFVLSIDVPSGFDSNTGIILGNCIKAAKTVTFETLKRGFLSYGADKYTGKVVVEGIGIPQSVINKFSEDECIIDITEIKKKLLPRNRYAHKGDYGRVAVIAGSKGFTGAAFISTSAAVKTGSGLVTLACPEAIQDILSTKLVEAMTVALESERAWEVIQKCNALAFGPGMGNNENTFQILSRVLSEANCPIIIDADGINVLEKRVQTIKESKNKLIFTPHTGEMSRLTGLSVEYIEQNRIEVAKSFAKEFKVTLLLKGFNTIITDGKTVIINPTGSSAMASGGMGDCLTGILLSLLGKGYEPMEACYIGAFVHGYCGDKLSKLQYSVTASSILEELPFTLKEIEKT